MLIAIYALKNVDHQSTRGLLSGRETGILFGQLGNTHGRGKGSRRRNTMKLKCACIKVGYLKRARQPVRELLVSFADALKICKYQTNESIVDMSVLLSQSIARHLHSNHPCPCTSSVWYSCWGLGSPPLGKIVVYCGKMNVRGNKEQMQQKRREYAEPTGQQKNRRSSKVVETNIMTCEKEL